MNEVVFHDNISMKHLCCVIENPFDGNLKRYLPKEKLTKNNEEINMNLLPCYCYYNDRLYRGIYQPKKSSQEWINKMNITYDTDISDEKLYYEKVKYFYENRNKCVISNLFR